MVIESVIALIFIIYLVFCYLKTKKTINLLLVVVLLALQLHGWPFFVPRAWSDAGLAAVMAVFALYDAYKEKNKKLVVYALVLLYSAVNLFFSNFLRTT